MLLRRITKHVQNQNWFAVFIDFLIVVVGVFIGIQVANWNGERKDRIEEKMFLERLYQESQALLDVNSEELKKIESSTNHLAKALTVLFSDQETRDLSAQECAAVIRSHVYPKAYDQLPILEELLGTGDLKLITNQSIKNELRAYITFRDRLRSSHGERINELYRLHSLYPDLILITHAEVDQAIYRFEQLNFSANNLCITSLMRANQKFMNELFDNAARKNSMVSDFKKQDELLNNIISQLSEVVK